MAEKVVTSGNGYYVYECFEKGSPTQAAFYEVRMAGAVVRRCERLGEAEEFIQYAAADEERNYDK